MKPNEEKVNFKRRWNVWKRGVYDTFFPPIVIVRDPAPTPLFDVIAITYKAIFAKDEDIIKMEKSLNSFYGSWGDEKSDGGDDAKSKQ